MKRPFSRTKTISTKVTEEELARLKELAVANGQGMSEWAREAMLMRLNPGLEIVLADILALRAILLNVAYALSRNEPLSSERMRELTTRADADKINKAKERLAITTQPRPAISAQDIKKEKV